MREFPTRTQQENQRFEMGTTLDLKAQGKQSSNVITKSSQTVFPMTSVHRGITCGCLSRMTAYLNQI